MIRALLVSALCALPACHSPQVEPARELPPPRPVAVIGASLSGGFGLAGELEANFDLARALALALDDPAAEFHALGNVFFFQDPEGIGPGQVSDARALEPGLVIALDFLVWYGYGYRGSCEARLASFEQGLALLDTLPCPLLVGDLLDGTPALDGKTAFRGGRPTIERGQIPYPDCLERLNARLHAWAAERERVHVFALDRYYRQGFSPEPFEMRGNVFDAQRKAGLLQPDLLHPTYRGTAAIALSALDRLVQVGLVSEEHVRWDAAALEQAIWRATEAERGERRARSERRRAAREAQREQAAPAQPETPLPSR